MDKQEEKLLVENWGKTLDAEGPFVKPIVDKSSRKNMAMILENTKNWLTEDNGTGTADLGIFRPIIMPVSRRIAPNLLANQLVGVQPLLGPTGQAFAWRVGYAGANDNEVTNALTKPLDRGDSANVVEFTSVIILVNDTTYSSFHTEVAANEASTKGSVIYDVTGAGSLQVSGADHGYVRYIEQSNGFSKVLIEYIQDSDGTPVRPFAASTDFWPAGSSTAAQYDSIINNEQLYNMVLTRFAGGGNANGYSTAQGEALGYTDDDIPTIKGTLEQATVTARTRKLKAEYSIEMAQDLKAVHNLDAEAELMNTIQTEIAAEIDRELIDTMRANAYNGGAWVFGNQGAAGLKPSAALEQLNVTGAADGRDEIMKFRSMYTRLVKEANQIARRTRKGAGNFIVVTTNALTALECLNNFTYSNVGNDIGQLGTFTFVGTLDGRFKVYVDTLFESLAPASAPNKDYALIGYKGPSAFDTGLVYCPYVPVMLQKTVHEKNFQPVIGAMTRSAIMHNLWGTSNYYTLMTLDFSNSQLA